MINITWNNQQYQHNNYLPKFESTNTGYNIVYTVEVGDKPDYTKEYKQDIEDVLDCMNTLYDLSDVISVKEKKLAEILEKWKCASTDEFFNLQGDNFIKTYNKFHYTFSEDGFPYYYG